MLDALLKSKFYCRCKSEIKLTMKRIEIIRRKRNAMLKFLRNDVADLLKTGLDSNAFDRVGQLYADQNISWCYEFVEQSCGLILSQLSAMNKRRECPEECKGAISTLMFAAARFADLPELRELRSLFAERYGNYLEPYVNQEFVKNLKADPPTEQIKLQMMYEIALEYGINWDSKALEQKLYKPPTFVQDMSRYTNGRNNESLKSHHQNGLETNVKNGLPYKPTDQVEKHRNPIIGNSLPYKSRAEIETKKEEKHDHGRLSPCWSSNTSSSSESATSADDSADEFRPMASPYIKTESTKKSTLSDASIPGREADNLKGGIPQGRLRSMGPPYIKPDLSKKTAGSNVNLKSHEEIEDVNKPVPRSMRIRRPLKQAAGSARGNNDGLKSIPKFSNGENNFLDHNYRDEEEKKMDKLLSHYSRKPSHLPAPKRTGSLPSEPVAAGGAVDERKGLSRAATYQPGPGHVHPKLPDYDDFVAQAAFRAGS
ncbi:hypothetical protein L1987_45191 [Smallanthus sonchifolius]|uniref:Uncharacterized protein n=1 Tax=Smallanthus sonchifolius TaxID=185202 RepID=A0ACB9GRJ3_9ASTR|nr:hypothetical protein L1987_45191 [Smallanthus sonchifolius]